MGIRRSWRLAASFLLLCAARLALAQGGAGTLTGVVIDGASGKVLIGAVVVATSPAAPGPRMSVTDALGAFTIGDLPAGPYRLSATLEGYLPEARADLALGEQVTLRANLALTPEAVRLDEVVVTGSHVRRKDLTTPAPLVVITREQLTSSGKASIAEFLQALPSQANAMNANYNNGGDGSVRVGLRGLGELRSLVLLNGRRFVAGGTGANASVDLGSIPAAAVERIEILMDGASPIYGADAIGGVVNIITRKGWHGTEATAFTGTSGHGDGTTYDVSVTTGRADAAGHLLLSLGYSAQEAVWSGNRPWGSYFWNYDAVGSRANSTLGVVGPYAVGSSAVPGGRIFTVAGAGVPQPNPGNDPRIDLYNQLVTAYPTATSFVPDSAEPLAWRPWAGNSLPLYGGDQYNFQPDNYLATPSERLSLFATGDARMGAGARAYFEVSYVDRRSEQKIAPEPLVLRNDGITLSSSNQYNPFGLELPNVTGRLMGLGNRTYSQEVDTLRVVAGFDGLLPEAAGPLEGWAWDLSAAFGRTDGIEVKKGYTRISRLREALGPSFDYGTAASPDWGCGTGPADRVSGCVPLNVFGAGGEVSPEARAFLTFDGAARGSNQLASFQTSANGPLFPLWADRRAAVAVGYEYRQVWGTYVPDTITESGDASTDGMIKRTSGDQDVHEAFAELSLPLAAGLPLVEELEAQLAARAFRYSGFGADWNWKVGARWKPIEDLTLRGTLSTAFRAPTVTERFYGASTDRFEVNDPCGAVDELGNTEPISPWCGTAAGTPEPLPVIAYTDVGNPDLRPETARVFTAGLVFEPRFAKGLSIALDLFGVDLDGTIQRLFDPLATCYPMGGSDVPRFCEQVRRDPATQVLTGLLSSPVNGGDERMWGLDLAIRYLLRTGVGRFDLAFDGTWLGAYDVAFPDGTVIHARGTYDMPGAGALHPAVKFNAGLAWRLDELAAGVDVRYLGSFKECADSGGNFPGAVCSLEHAYERQISPYAAWSARVGYGLTTAAGKTDLLLGVQNLLDTRPPTIYWSVYPSDPGYDFVGRFFYVRLTHRL